MRPLTEREHHLLTLSCVPGLGERGFARLLQTRLSLARLAELPAEELRARFGLTARAADALSGSAGPQGARARALAPLLCRYAIRLLERGSPGYPNALLGMEAESPPLLFAYGNLGILDRPAVALLSSRNESREGLERTSALAESAARAGLAVIAGHNRPCYRAAIATAKAVAGSRIVVLDRGILNAFGGDLDRDLFPTARVWGYSFEPEQTLVLSPCPLEAAFAGLNNQRRDRLVARLARWIVAVEVRPWGVMEPLCQAAHDWGTPVHVCAGPGVPEGNRALLAGGLPPLPPNATPPWGPTSAAP